VAEAARRLALWSQVARAAQQQGEEGHALFEPLHFQSLRSDAAQLLDAARGAFDRLHRAISNNGLTDARSAARGRAEEEFGLQFVSKTTLYRSSLTAQGQARGAPPDTPLVLELGRAPAPSA